MPLLKGIDQPIHDFLADLNVPASGGVCMVSDPRGIADAAWNKRYAYCLLPVTAAKTVFILVRIDLESRALMMLAAPPLAVAGAYNCAIMAAEYVPLGTATENRPCVYVIVSLTAAPWNQLMVYDIWANTWTVLTAIPGMAAPLGTSVDLVNCSADLMPGAGMAPLLILNRYIYITGDNTGGGGVGNLGGAPGTVSNISRYNIVANAHVLLTGAGGARAAAPGAGSKVAWLPNIPNILYCTRGGASALWDEYGITIDTWNVHPAMVPPIPLGEGTEITTLFEAPTWIAIRTAELANQIVAVAMPGTQYQTICATDFAFQPLAYASNALIAWWIAGQYYLGVIPYARSTVKRIQLPMPL